MSRTTDTLRKAIFPKRSREDESGLFTTVDEAIESSKRTAEQNGASPEGQTARADRIESPLIADRI